MADILEIRVENIGDDVRGQQIAREAAEICTVAAPATADVYYAEGISEDQALQLGERLLANPVTQQVVVGPREDWDDPLRVEITDREGMINSDIEPIRTAAKRLGIPVTNLALGTEVRFSPDTPIESIGRVVKEQLVNKEIQEVREQAPRSLTPESRAKPTEQINLSMMTDNELMQLSDSRKYGLSLVKMQALQRESHKTGGISPEAGLRLMGPFWSDHCRHETFGADLIVNGEKARSLFGRIKDRAKKHYEQQGVEQAFDGNSAVFRTPFYKDGKQLAVNIKGETHNHPTLIEAEGGVATGVGGLIRDILMTGKGFKPIATVVSLGIGALELKKEQLPRGLQTPLQIFRRAVSAVSKYGNRIGVGTVDIAVHHHQGYSAKPMFKGISIGLGEVGRSTEESPVAGDVLFVIGGRTGMDGVGGATGSSAASNTETLADTSEVQKPGAYEEEKMIDAVLEASRLGYIRAGTDCGAGGVGLAAGELGNEIGVIWDADKLPLKAADFEVDYKIISESQERAVLAVAPEHVEAVIAIFAKHDSEATAIGVFGNGGDCPRYTITSGDDVVSDWEYDFIKNALPPLEYVANYVPPEVEERSIEVSNYVDALRRVLAHDDISSTEPAIRQFDHEVQGMNVLKPFTGIHMDSPNYATVLAPILGQDGGIVFAQSAHPALTDLDPIRGTEWVVDDLFGRIVAVGGDPRQVKGNNNYISPRPNEQVMGTLLLSVDTLLDKLDGMGTAPFTGKDSCSGEHTDEKGNVIKNPYYLGLGGVTFTNDIKETTSTDIKRTDSTLVLVGQQDLDAMGGSILYDIYDGSSAKVPRADHGMSDMEFYTHMHEVIRPQHVLSCGVVGKGGLATTVSKMLFGGDCGATLNFDGNSPLERVLFNETPALVIEVPADAHIAELLGNIPHQVIGTTQPDKFLYIEQEGTGQLFSDSVDELKQVWKATNQEALA